MSPELPGERMRRERQEAAASDAMNEAETMKFLDESGVARSEGWKPGEAVLYVLEEKIRTHYGPYGEMPANRRPSIVRVDNPLSIAFDSPHVDEDEPDRVTCKLESGGRNDYFVINKSTGQPMHVRSSPEPSHKYNVRTDRLFKANDSLFPPGKE